MEKSQAQILTNWPCHAVSEDNSPNYYFRYDPATGLWTEVGPTGTINIESIAYDPTNDILYGVNLDTLGYINQTTGFFTIINNIGTGEGSLGTYDFADVDGLSFDPVRNVLWASERRAGVDLDIIFQIDLSTGLVKQNAFGTGVDYLVIPAVTDPVSGVIYDDIDDVAYDPYTGVLYANIIQSGGTGGGLITIDYENGGTPTFINSYPVDDMEGLGFNYFGDLYGSTGDNGPDPDDSNRFFYINPETGEVTEINTIDTVRVDFESFDCFSAFNDLAMTKDFSPNQAMPITHSDTVTYEVVVENQGNMPNSNIEITDYIANGLILIPDPNWTLNGNKATAVIPGPLNPQDTYTLYISFTIDPNATGTIVNTAEISYSEFPTLSPPIVLPDIDSQTDTIPSDEDEEDDHDTATFTLPTYDVSLEKTVDQSVQVVDSRVVFTLTVVNNGEGDVTGATVTDILPNGSQYITDDANGAYNNSTGIWTIGDMAVGDTVTIDITVKLTEPGVVTNEASVTINEPEPNTTNNEDKTCVSVPVELCDDGSQVMTAEAEAGFASYQWYLDAGDGNGYVAIAGETAQTLSISTTGSFIYTVDGAEVGDDCGDQMCCPIIVELVDCTICPPELCVPISVTKK